MSEEKMEIENENDTPGNCDYKKENKGSKNAVLCLAHHLLFDKCVNYTIC